MLTLESLRERKDEILTVAEKHGARNVRVFGSVARGDATRRNRATSTCWWNGSRAAACSITPG